VQIIRYVPGQRFNLEKGATFEIPTDCVTMGLGWDPCRGGNMDVDASVLVFDQNAQPTTVVFWGNLAVPGINHKGDNLTGEGGGDDEQVVINFSSLDPSATVLIFVVNIYTQGRVFKDVDNEFCRLLEGTGGSATELCRQL